jgi:hypothetical protein
MFYMNRDGFSLLVMGFTGKEALEWKIKYINAFNEMEKQLATPKLAQTPRFRSRNFSTALTDMAKTKETLQKMFKMSEGMAFSKAISMIEPLYGVSFDSLKELIPAAEHQTGFLTATEIGERVEMNAKEVNLLLAGYGFQHKEGKVWRLDEAGRQYGEEIPYTAPSGHSGYQIRWNESVVDYVQEQMKCKKKLEIDWKIAEYMSRLDHKQWQFMETAYGIVYDMYIKDGRKPTVENIVFTVGDFLEKELQRRRATCG